MVGIRKLKTMQLYSWMGYKPGRERENKEHRLTYTNYVGAWAFKQEEGGEWPTKHYVFVR